MFCVLVISQAAEEQVNRLCLEAQESMVMGRWLYLVNLMLTSADLIFSKVSDNGTLSSLFFFPLTCY